MKQAAQAGRLARNPTVHMPLLDLAFLEGDMFANNRIIFLEFQPIWMQTLILSYRIAVTCTCSTF